MSMTIKIQVSCSRCGQSAFAPTVSAAHHTLSKEKRDIKEKLRGLGWLIASKLYLCPSCIHPTPVEVIALKP